MSTKDDLMASLMMGSASVPSTGTDSEDAVANETDLGRKDLFDDDIDFQNEPPPLATPENTPTTQNPLSVNDMNYSVYGDAHEMLPSGSVGVPLVPPVPPPVAAPMPPPVPPPVAAPPPKPSMLAESGLLGPTTEDPDSLLFSDDGVKEGAGSGGLFDDIDQQEAEDIEKTRLAEVERQRVEAENLDRKQQEEQAEQLHRQQEQEKLNQQSLQDQMQSVYLGESILPNGAMYGSTQQYASLHPPQQTASQINGNEQQLSLQPQYGEVPVKHVDVGFYRDREPPVSALQAQQTYSSPGLGQPGIQQQSPQYQPQQSGSYNTGFQNQSPSMLMPPQLLHPTQPPPPIQQPMYGRVTISDPVMVQSQSVFGIRQPPHWSYQIATQILPQPPHSPSGCVWLVRRRFRHVVALEDRLREDCPGAILPPR
jgi:ribosomal protein L9